jgi:superfamily II DNA/RNA helicase
LRDIFERCPEPRSRKKREEGGVEIGRQTMMFTATWPKAVRKMAAKFLAGDDGDDEDAGDGDGDGGYYVKIFLGEGGDGDGAALAANRAVSQRFIRATDDEKDKHMYEFLCALKEGSRVVAFANTKRRVEMLTKAFWNHGFGCVFSARATDATPCQPHDMPRHRIFPHRHRSPTNH